MNNLSSSGVATMKYVFSYPYELRKIEKWNIERGYYDVHFELWEHYTGFRGKIKWRQVTTKWFTEGGTIKSGVYGDIEWAKRTAKHYNLKVPK